MKITAYADHLNFKKKKFITSVQLKIMLLSFLLIQISTLLPFRVSAQQEYQIQHLNMEDGLTNNTVTSIIQDHQGYIWIGTLGGLNKYDGYSIKTYEYDPDEDGLISSSIETLYCDKEGDIWIGTKDQGISKYNYCTEQFTSYTNHPNDDQSSLSGNRVFQFFEDQHDTLWAVTRNHGLNKHLGSGKFERHPIKNLVINNVLADQNGNFWIVTDKNSLVIYNPNTRDIQPIKFEGIFDFDFSTLGIRDIKQSLDKKKIWLATWGHGIIQIDLSYGYSMKPSNILFTQLEETNATTSRNNDIYTLLVTSDNELWAGSWGNGLYLLKQGKITQQLKRDYRYPNSLSADVVISLFEDRNGIFWVGTEKGGLNIIKKNNSGFRTYAYDFFDDQSLNGEKILSLYVKDSEIYVGTVLGGINQISIDQENFKIKRHQKIANKAYASKSSIHAVLVDSYNHLWFGDLDFGLFLAQQPNDLSSHVKHFDKSVLGGDKVTVLMEDSRQNIIIGTQRNGFCKIEMNNQGEIISIKNHSELFKNHQSDKPNRVRAIIESKSGPYWAASHSGLYQMNKELSKNDKMLEGIYYGIFETKDQKFWLSSAHGLIHFDPKSNKIIKRITKKDGLSSNNVFAVLPGNESNILWVSTAFGLNRVDTSSGEITNFWTTDGLVNNTFYENCAFKTQKGVFYFGGNKGLTVFNEDSINVTRPASQLKFNTLTINNNQIIKVGSEYFDQVILKNNINLSKKISLTHHITNFTLDFSDLDYSQNKKGNYEYRLQGKDKEWIRLQTNKSISFSNLANGSYILKVRKTNMSEQGLMATLEIIILPPYWKTNWAYTCYVVISLSLFFLLIRFARVQYKLRNKLKIETVTRVKESELTRLKLQFFTNISHELRTPLTLISAPVEELINSNFLPSQMLEKVHMMQRNIRSLTRMAEHLISFRKVESDKMKYHIEIRDIRHFCEELTHEFKLASKGDYTFSFDSNVQSLEVYFDPSKIEMILYNLISNAVKFSDKDKVIQVFVQSEAKYPKYPDDRFFSISVTDHGIGIPEEALEKVLDRFQQLGMSQNNTGAGIGLALVSKLVELHKGYMNIASEEGVGSSFTIYLPKREDWFIGLEYVEVKERTTNSSISKDRIDSLEDMFANESEETDEHLTLKSSILVVEDNMDLLKYIKSLFNDKYVVHEANNGIKALKKLEEESIDLVITDVMMPEMNGIELCQSIKSNMSFSHIPVIFLTAKVEEESQVEGIETGAEDYISKPFSPIVITAKVDALFEKRHQLKDYYKKEFLLQPTEIEFQNEDEKFLLQIKQIVEDNLLDSDQLKISIQEEIPMSKATLYRKLKALTGGSISEFIRTIRIKKASQLLQSSGISISEIAYSVGFNDLKYFRKCFEQIHHCTPSDYKSKALNSSLD